jgi:hypothetical protein
LEDLSQTLGAKMSGQIATAVKLYLTERSLDVKHGTLASIRAALKEEFIRRWGNPPRVSVLERGAGYLGHG